MNKLFFSVIITMWWLAPNAHAQPESAYIDLLGQHLNGQTEVPIKGGRIDILTDEYAYEVERAQKWKNAIGQALWYALSTNKKPGIILIVNNQKEWKYLVQLNSTLQYAGLDNVSVWTFPQDFPALQLPSYKSSLLPALNTTECPYWLSKNSNKRHNPSCQHYRSSKGGCCTKNEGEAAGCCGG